MDGQGRILQQGIQRRPLEGDRVQPGERVGGKDGEGQKQGRQRALDGDGRGLQTERQPPGPGQGPAEHGHDQAPQQQRAFVAAPGRGHLVEHGLVGVAVGGDVGDREIALRKGVDQHRIGQDDGHGRREGRALARTGEHRTAPDTTGRRQTQLKR